MREKMTKRLQEKRDGLAKEWTRGWNPLADETNSVIALNYKKGFKDCAAFLIPEIEKLKSTIDCAAKYLESCGYNDVDQSEPEFQMLQSFYKAMQSLEEFLNGGDDV